LQASGFVLVSVLINCAEVPPQLHWWHPWCFGCCVGTGCASSSDEPQVLLGAWKMPRAPCWR